MKRLLTILGGIFVALILIVGALVAFLAFRGSALDEESHAFADASIQGIAKDWDVGQLEARASPEFRSAANDADLQKLFGMFRKLGSLKQYKGSKGEATMSATTQQGASITAHYVANAEFEAGPASIELNLIKHQEAWEILGIRVNSKALLPAD
ncbi:MAG: hypothetical protein JO001_08860 [Alphaproteobacteria bacterium]|nr:hypothetical protein [Alphaproteobacteria bacterium]